MNDLASIYRSQGRHEEAGELHMQVMEISSRVLGLEHLDTVSQYNVPLLSDSTPLEFPIDATAEVFVATHHPTFIGERSNEGLHNLHGLLQTLEPNLCQVCFQSFPSNAELERHAQSLQHKAFGCKCGKTYARLDILKRHCDSTPKFPCPHCNRYTGANAFRREDHLTQHLRTYHRIKNNNTTGDDNNAPMQFDTLTSMADLASTYRSQGRLDEADVLKECART